MSRAPKHIEQKIRGGTYRAVLAIPKDLQAYFGGRKAFRKSLNEYNPCKAEVKAMPWVYQWKALIEQARGGDVAHDPQLWRARLETTAPGSEDRALVDADITKAARGAAGFGALVDEKGQPEVWGTESPDELREMITTPPQPSESQAVAIAAFTRKVVDIPTDEYVEEWLSTLDVGGRDRAAKRKAIAILTDRFATLSIIKRRDVQTFVDNMIASGARSRNTVQGIKGSWAGYWSFLQRREIVSEDATPVDVKLPRESAKSKQERAKTPWSTGEIVALHSAAPEVEQDLADFILIAAYTGARGVEIGQIKVEDVDKNLGWFTIRDSKTAAGQRNVPLHSTLAELFRRRIGERTEGFLIDFKAPKEDIRHRRITRNFGNLKDRMGYAGSGKDFHSIRRTVAAELQNADVPEPIAAAILGHAISTMSYGLYSGGPKMELLQKAIETLEYPLQGAAS